MMPSWEGKAATGNHSLLWVDVDVWFEAGTETPFLFANHFLEIIADYTVTLLHFLDFGG